MRFKIREVSILSEDAQNLIARLDHELMAEYAPEDRHTVEFDSFHDSGGLMAVAYHGTEPIACGALRPITLDGSQTKDVELKRMFVSHESRGCGVSRCLVEWLASRAVRLGYDRILLETGDEQRIAQKLYESCGFQFIEPFGEYEGGARSVCFQKRLERYLEAECRAVQPDEVNRVQQISLDTIDRCYRSFLGDSAVDSYLSSGAVEEYVRSNQPSMTVIESSKQIVGVSVVSESLIDLMMIAPEHQRQGLGQRLLQHVECELLLSYRQIELESFSENDQANAFYASNGWRPVDTFHDEASGHRKTRMSKSRR